MPKPTKNEIKQLNKKQLIEAFKNWKKEEKENEDGLTNCIDCRYCTNLVDSQNCRKCSDSTSLFRCNNVINSENCYDSHNLDGCTNVYNSNHLLNCQDCICCKNLENVQYFIFDTEFTKQEYDDFYDNNFQELLGAEKAAKETKKK